MMSSCSSTSCSRLTLRAPSAPSSWSTVRGPMMGAVTAGLRSSQANATSAGGVPMSEQSFSHRSSFGRLRSDLLLHTIGPAPALSDLLQGAAEQATVERAPWDDPDAVVEACRQHLELDGAGAEVVEALLGDEAKEVAAVGGLVGLDDVPCREVAAPDVENLALLHEQLH